MGRAYCPCGFVPAEDDHDCKFDRLVRAEQEAHERGDLAEAARIEDILDKMGTL